MAKQIRVPYENNPFYIGLNGLKLLFNRGQQIAIFAIALSILGFIANGASSINDAIRDVSMSESEISARERQDAEALTQLFQQDAGVLAVVGVIIASALFLLIVIWLLIYGIHEYAAARLAADEKVELRQAFGEVGRNLASYIWLNIIIAVKVLLWSLLLIVPGIIMMVRYSLAGTVFFAEGKRGNAAVKRSLELTKGAWVTTFAGQGLWNLMTFSQITLLILPGANAILYRQLRAMTDAGEPKPPAHWLSWLALIVPIVLFTLAFLLIILAILAFLAFSASTAP